MADDHSTSDALKQISSTVRLAKEEEELIGDPPEGIAAHQEMRYLVAHTLEYLCF